MRSVASLLICLWLASCALAPPASAPQPPWRDSAFGPPSERIDPTAVFAMSEAMQQYLRTQILPRARSMGRQQALADALARRRLLRLEYDAEMTRNAAQAFDARAGNCLSLVVMAAAFAKAMDLKVEYRSAWLEETWSRQGDLLFRSGHVNLTLGPRFGDTTGRGDTTTVTIDFLPSNELRGLRTRTVDEPTLVAMFMNNRAAEALAQGRLDDAYAWSRAAIGQAPAFLSAHNTLGVVYLRRGETAAAEQVFRGVLAREAENTRAMSNLVQALTRSGQAAEAAAVQARLAALEPHPPFHFFQLGRAAMERHDYAAARDWFAKEVARADDRPEFHYWLALAHFRLGETERARRHLARAHEHGTTRQERALYAAKLEWLRARGLE
jgi:tetratricopeptide (TPR) repeat protein